MSTRLRWSIAIAFVVLLVGGYAAWVGASAWQASKVSITASELVECKDPRSIVADEDRVWANQGDTPEERTGPIQAVRLDRRLDWLLRTQVTNRSGLSVEVERLTWTGLGPEGGAVTAAWPYQGGPELLRDEMLGLTHATFDMTGYGRLDEELTQFAVRVTYEKGCFSDEAEGWVGDSPQAVVRVLGLTHTITATGQGVGFQGTPESSCDEDLDDS